MFVKVQNALKDTSFSSMIACYSDSALALIIIRTYIILCHVILSSEQVNVFPVFEQRLFACVVCIETVNKAKHLIAFRDGLDTDYKRRDIIKGDINYLCTNEVNRCISIYLSITILHISNIKLALLANHT